MPRNGDDKLLIPAVFEDKKLEEWIIQHSFPLTQLSALENLAIPGPELP